MIYKRGKIQKENYINIKISFIVVILITIVSMVFIKNNYKTEFVLSKVNTDNNRIEKKDTVTSRYEVDRETHNSVESTELSSDELLEEYIEYAHSKEVRANDIGINIEDVRISRDMDITKRTGLSKENFKILVSQVKADTSKFFYDNSDLIYDLCEKYELNEIFFCGLISAESGWDIAANHRRTCNYISLMTSGGLIRFNSVEEGLEGAAKTLHKNYLSESGCFYYGKTLSAMQTKFCPGSSTWVDLVYGRMKQML